MWSSLGARGYQDAAAGEPSLPPPLTRRRARRLHRTSIQKAVCSAAAPGHHTWGTRTTTPARTVVSKACSARIAICRPRGPHRSPELPHSPHPGDSPSPETSGETLLVPDVWVLADQSRDLQVEQRRVRELNDLCDGDDGVTVAVHLLSKALWVRTALSGVHTQGSARLPTAHLLRSNPSGLAPQRRRRKRRGAAQAF